MRWLALDDDPTTGGTSLDDIAGLAGAVIPIPAPADAVVPTTAQVEPGLRPLTRENDITGVRAASAPVEHSSSPSLTFSSRAWTGLSKRLMRKAMGGSVASSGAPPAAVSSTVQMAGSGANLPALIGTLVRESQVDRVTGLWVNELTFNFPADEEGTLEASLMGLYHDNDDIAAVPGLPAIAGNTDTVAYMMRDVVAIMGDGAGVAIDCLGGFGFTLNNNLTDDFRTRFCGGKNIWEVTIDGKLHRLWYPDRNAVRGHAVTGRLDYGTVRPDRELRRLVSHAEKLVVELSADPLGTTPAADEMMRLVFHNQAPLGGGAEPLTREEDQQSSYEFTAYLEPSNGKDLEATFIGTAALT